MRYMNIVGAKIGGEAEALEGLLPWLHPSAIADDRPEEVVGSHPNQSGVLPPVVFAAPPCPRAQRWPGALWANAFTPTRRILLEGARYAEAFTGGSL